MARNIFPFPVLTPSLMKKMRFIDQGGYKFRYEHEGLSYPLESQELSIGSLGHKIYDQSGRWTMDECNLFISRRVSLENYAFLFGSNGLACSNAVLGLALQWSSADSKQRGAVEIGEFKKDKNPLTFELDFKFRRGQLRGIVTLNTVIYIKKPGTPFPGEDFLANFGGALLGTLDSYQIVLDGSGSTFPIYEVSNPGQPLWWISFEWDDPEYDQFYDSVSLYLNSAHQSYNRLDPNSKKFDKQLMVEIMASAVGILMEKLKDSPSWEKTLDGNDLEEGSVCSAVNYFITTLGFSDTSPENLSLEIRKYFDQELKS